MFSILIILFFAIFGLFFFLYGLIYRKMYKRLRYLALSGSRFKEKKGDLMVQHPLMKENRWEYLTEAYQFAIKPRNHLEAGQNDLEFEEFQTNAEIAENIESDQYIPGQWKSKENAIDE